MMGMHWLDLAISAPVTLFLVWLYWYSTPSVRSPGVRAMDRCLLVVAPTLAIAIIVTCHRLLEIEGMGLNVIAVAAAYLAVCGVFGLGWLVRRRRQRPAPARDRIDNPEHLRKNRTK